VCKWRILWKEIQKKRNRKKSIVFPFFLLFGSIVAHTQFCVQCSVLTFGSVWKMPAKKYRYLTIDFIVFSLFGPVLTLKLNFCLQKEMFFFSASQICVFFSMYGWPSLCIMFHYLEKIFLNYVRCRNFWAKLIGSVSKRTDILRLKLQSNQQVFG
jgi:hypothetical protein